MSRRRRHPIRWVAGAVLAAIAVVGVVLATRTPQEATAVQSPLLGHPAPEIRGANLLGGAGVSLSSLRGHYVVVNFFASWCTPCQQEAPDLSRFAYDQAHTKGTKGGADLISVVFHDTTSSAHSFLDANGDLWPAVTDPGGTIAARYGVTSPPTTFVIDSSGRVSAVLLGPTTGQNLERYLQPKRSGSAASDG
jgi:cytochrome c biogenesis protein CcmG/thiol:disulfide interchange protein DsbE